jgi:hypothetical protein
MSAADADASVGATDANTAMRAAAATAAAMCAAAAPAAMTAAAAATMTAARRDSYALATRGIFLIENHKGRQTDVGDFLLA